MKRIKGREFAFWGMYTALAPVIIVSLTYIFGTKLANVEHAFGEFFGGGDLFPLAALLLLSVAADIRIESERRELDYFSMVSEPIFAITAFAAALSYGALKMHALEMRNNADLNLVPFAKLSVNFTMYVLVHTSLVKAVLIFGRGQGNA